MINKTLLLSFINISKNIPLPTIKCKIFETFTEFCQKMFSPEVEKSWIDTDRVLNKLASNSSPSELRT